MPVGAGLSSSAGLECATALALTGLAGRCVPRRELVEITRRAENDFVGVPSGIMDQSASLLCEAGHALLLDCGTLEISQVPFDPAAAGIGLLVINTRAEHAHAGGDYARRRAECEQAARQLGVPFLGRLTDAADAGRLADPVLRGRARHVITDNARVRAAVDLLRSASGDPDAYREIGALLSAAHRSLRDDFEVSWPQADVTVDAATAAGALGARMIGGGFGGSVLALVPADAGPAVRAAVADAFRRRIVGRAGVHRDDPVRRRPPGGHPPASRLIAFRPVAFGVGQGWRASAVGRILGPAGGHRHTVLTRTTRIKPTGFRGQRGEFGSRGCPQRHTLTPEAGKRRPLHTIMAALGPGLFRRSFDRERGSGDERRSNGPFEKKILPS